MAPDDELMDPFSEESIVWQCSPSNARIIFYSLKYMSIGPMIFLLLGCILALTGVMRWIGLLLFGGAGVFAFVIACFALSRQRRTIYTITEENIIINYPAMTCISEFANIEKIKKSHSLHNKNVGTIKFKVKKGWSINYQFVNIDDVDTVYDLVISLWEKHKNLQSTD